jgi:hypothetical protein
MESEVVMSLRTLIVGLLLAPTTVMMANEPVSLRVSPAVSFAPATLVIQVRIAADAHGRALEIVANSDEFYRASTIPLESDGVAKTTTLQYASVPPGQYEVTATVITSDGKRKAVARAEVKVMGWSSSH